MFLSVAEVAQQLNWNLDQVYRCIDEGYLPACQDGHRILIDAEDLADFIERVRYAQQQEEQRQNRDYYQRSSDMAGTFLRKSSRNADRFLNSR